MVLWWKHWLLCILSSPYKCVISVHEYWIAKASKKEKIQTFLPAILPTGELSAGANSCIWMRHLLGLACLGTIGQCLETSAGHDGVSWWTDELLPHLSCLWLHFVLCLLTNFCKIQFDFLGLQLIDTLLTGLPMKSKAYSPQLLSLLPCPML